MNSIRWIVFLPVAAISISVTQLATAWLVDVLVTWAAIAIVVLLSIVISTATAIPVRIAPKPKTGAAILLLVFIPVEALAIFSAEMGGGPLAVRVLTDIALVIGALAGSRSSAENARIPFMVPPARARFLDEFAMGLVGSYADHRDVERSADAIGQNCRNRAELQYLMRAIDQVMRVHSNASYKARAAFTTSLRQMARQWVP